LCSRPPALIRRNRYNQDARKNSLRSDEWLDRGVSAIFPAR
jgi:hypothetical protein